MAEWERLVKEEARVREFVWVLDECCRHEKMLENARFCSRKVFAKLWKSLARESHIYKEESLIQNIAIKLRIMII